MPSPDPPPIDTLRIKQQLTNAAFTDQQAEALIEMLRQWSKHMATKEDLRRQSWQMLGALAVLLALFEFVV